MHMPNRAALLTPKDLNTIEKLLIDPHCGGDHIRKLMRQKIANAQITLVQDLPDNVVTIGTRVTFSVDDGYAIERMLVVSDQHIATGLSQTLATPRGLALLGHQVGDVIGVDCGDHIETLRVLDISFQPEAAKRLATKQIGRGLTLVSSNDDEARQYLRPVGAPYWDGNDPGPSAA